MTINDQSLKHIFFETFEQVPTQLVYAPGRVNLIGEHTDYNNGFVLPCAINYGTLVAVAPRNDRRVRVLAIDSDHAFDEFSLDEPIAFNPNAMWTNYIRGMVTIMQSRGYKLEGCNLAITGDVPQGAGLSSSAALEVGVGKALAVISELEIGIMELAQLAQAAENQFVGCPCGIMDQLISACGHAGEAMLIDCHDLSLKPVTIPDHLTIIIIDSKVKRGLVDSEYSSRRRQCEQAARYFDRSSLRDVSLQEFELRQSALPPLVRKRAQHVLEENQRTLDAAEALRTGNITLLSQLMAASHTSMKNLFEITVPQIDFLVDLIAGELGERGGVRMTGGGFGGCVVALLPHSLAAEITALVEANYEIAWGRKASIYRCRPSDGVALLKA